MTAAPALEFFKLEALANDFVLVDARRTPLELVPATRILLADRRLGIGCDQLLILQAAQAPTFARVRIYNADGSMAEQCGNGMRAIAAWADRCGLLGEGLRLDTDAGPVTIAAEADGYSAELPGPRAASWQDAGLAQPRLPAGMHDPVLWSLGNPHLVVTAEHAPDAAALATLVDALDRQGPWSKRVNIGLACARDGWVELRVHERGSGPTPACGSGACAAAAHFIGAGRLSTPLRVVQPGGELVVDWESGKARIRTLGAARVVFQGFLERLPA
ncbi:MAG: diaminopimelate epimerase [Wenzhouxiangellaceae bacterium]|nr:diaminopimelate epimerase [Wenzhouxiangellaceae bacterium]